MGNVIGVILIAVSIIWIWHIKDEIILNRLFNEKEKNGSCGVNSAAADKDQEVKK